MLSEHPPPPPQPAPGWYPDPAGVGHGLQRYFDGSKWTSEWAFNTERPAAARPVSRERPKNDLRANVTALALAALTALVLVIVVGRSWVLDKTHDSPSTAPGATTPSAATEAAPSRTTGPKMPDGMTFASVPGPNGEVINARFAIRDNYTETMIKDGARHDTIDILRYAKATYPDASAVNVQGTFPMTDPYGNTSTQVAIDLTYSRETLNKINFDGVSKKSIWEIRDSGSVLPAFEP
ncbi:DUF2510 domain-containing protein [Mycobacterium stomatepiae]|uniref:DUF2510 domain-containing protein n=1 Tax=Mycobacterium stomatepiae TaxID=470076 RepID=A0A7I7Q3Y8_9MYCO|nr:DUF2510 domain-containing protein [Mycobacterium stomatepiae]MCV7165891.1 DUF2510 domain-containing protein [Mycobacterium stomatepiae]BBY20767.1 hypothetical protein MSTO_09720 [Mycobacterium stomatepiae]